MIQLLMPWGSHSEKHEPECSLTEERPTDTNEQQRALVFGVPAARSFLVSSTR
jgi:hypothetical protein